MAAYGSGAVARSIRDGAPVMNVDVGGGTSKIAVCADGKVVDLTAVDVGARLVCSTPTARSCAWRRPAGASARSSGLDLELGGMLTLEQGRALAARMADKLFEAMRGGAPRAGGAALLRLDPLATAARCRDVSFSGGVSEFIYGNEAKTFGDLGPLLAAEIRARVAASGPRLEPPEGIRATVVGASQYTIQVSGSTIFVCAARDAAAAQRAGDRAGFAARARRRSIPPRSSARSQACSSGSTSTTASSRSRCSCRGAARRRSGGSTPSAAASPTDCEAVLAHGHPLVLAGDGDVGGLLGIHLREEMKLTNPVVSIDGLELKEFDYIDIGAMLESSGAVPVVIKSLIFPTSAALGQEWKARAGDLRRRCGRQGKEACFRLQVRIRGASFLVKQNVYRNFDFKRATALVDRALNLLPIE